jgi:hypothetical protein
MIKLKEFYYLQLIMAERAVEDINFLIEILEKDCQHIDLDLSKEDIDFLIEISERLPTDVELDLSNIDECIYDAGRIINVCLTRAYEYKGNFTNFQVMSDIWLVIDKLSPRFFEKYVALTTDLFDLNPITGEKYDTRKYR